MFNYFEEKIPENNLQTIKQPKPNLKHINFKIRRAGFKENIPKPKTLQDYLHHIKN
jgi:hypothetical protein